MSTMTLHRPIPQTRQASTLRLTRRGRLVVLLLALGVVLGVGFALASGSVATQEAGTPEPTRVVMVGAGDTLWDIAADVDPEGDTRSTMEEITRLNALDSSMVTVGQQLIVPDE
ncbi:LysM peptidoglycan-binding domain-containing protein [Nocardioides lijunqiniae]|uniref:LysM peptidoglycan-binding domain-containing protein n=1 Tax=Nocardioides lijunqiniae TaxID=2760832 RepID=UPI001877B53F|nr:LysM peptidoglycan-binding domain-containing protein [Nocardioides lijunqiniae]